MLKARKTRSNTLLRTASQEAKADTPKSAPLPLDADKQRLVGGGTASPTLPNKGW